MGKCICFNAIGGEKVSQTSWLWAHYNIVILSYLLTGFIKKQLMCCYIS